jgi:DNA-binding SARP family transcriptional activator
VFQIIALGSPTIRDSNGEPTRLTTRRRAVALVALVAASGREGLSRDRALALLWPELNEHDARNNLKQTVFSIRRAIHPEIFHPAPANLAINACIATVDLHEYERALSAGALQKAVDLYGGPFLDGFHVPGMKELERWIDRARGRYALQQARALETLAADATARADTRSAVRWRRRLVEHDPVSTEYALGLFSALVDAGEPHAALDHIRTHTRLIREEFDAEPDRRIRLAADDVRQRMTLGSATRPAGPTSRRESIVAPSVIRIETRRLAPAIRTASTPPPRSRDTGANR